MRKKTISFIIKNDLCWFSEINKYKSMTVVEVCELNPTYIMWCISNLKSIKFDKHILILLSKERAKRQEQREKKYGII